MTLTDPGGNAVTLPNPAMNPQGAPATCNSTLQPSCIFELQYTLPASPTAGVWIIRVDAAEGVEGTVTDFGVATFTVVVPQPSLTIIKTSRVVSDPVSASFPKRIPQSVVEYEITTTNSGPGTVDANTLEITDAIPANAAMYVARRRAIP